MRGMGQFFSVLWMVPRLQKMMEIKYIEHDVEAGVGIVTRQQSKGVAVDDQGARFRGGTTGAPLML